MFTEFLPVSKEEMINKDWYYYDFLVVTGDAYVDHPSFGSSVISRVLENKGYRVAVLAQPEWNSPEAFLKMGKPRYGVFISAGNLDSMVAHYTAAKKRRSEDFYSPGKKMGKRPDRAVIVYANRAREAFPDTTIVIGGLEASLRRFAHYDYWDDKVRRSVLADSKADLLVYGMGERATLEAAAIMAAKKKDFSGIRGAAYMASDICECKFPSVECASFEIVSADKAEYAKANLIQYEEHDPIRGKAIIQKHADRYLIVNPPARPLNTEELDKVFELPYTRKPHPMYDSMGGVPSIEEVKFSIIHNRGCIGACNFCALAFHQGRMITSRSHESVIREAKSFLEDTEFKGYIHDVGGPTANFRHVSCKQQLKNGMCKGKNCLFPKPCSNLDASHSDYLSLLKKLREIPGIKKVFVRSGIRYDYMLAEKNNEFFSQLVKYHVSGQLKVAPEHCMNNVLYYMGKPSIEVYDKFMEQYKKLNQRWNKEQYIVPYLMSSHPGSKLSDAVALAEYLNKRGRQPEQVQDFYPTPGTLSTCMYYTEIDPRTMKPVYVAKSPREKAMQRALLQWKNPQKRQLVIEALKEAGREDLIGYGKECLVRPFVHGGEKRMVKSENKKSAVQKRNGARKNPEKRKRHV